MSTTQERTGQGVARLADALAEARRFTDELVAPLDDDQLLRQFSPLQSPLAWDLAHIAHYEELWLIREIVGGGGTSERFDDLYDAFAHPRIERIGLDILQPAEARAFLGDVRERALAALPHLREAPDPRLGREGFAVGLVVQHELQHAETMCQTLQTAGDLVYPQTAGPVAAPIGGRDPGEVLVPGGSFVLGTSSEPWAYDNEREAHVVDLPAFHIDATAVTNAAYSVFIDEGGYRDRRSWSDAGWRWLRQERADAPLYWQREGGTWCRRRFGRVEPVPGDEPVQHVSWFEADAYARWCGRRLPTEAEWEKAATMAADGTKLSHPWGAGSHRGRANVGRDRLAPAAVGTYPQGASPTGCLGMIGDVWEWTASAFAAYPGFTAFPYREYSEEFFGDAYRVLRGGSWATHPLVARATFRNWDHPQRRQIFSGFRCARDAS